MSLAFRNEIDVTVLLARATIADVEIVPRTRPPLMRLFDDKPASSLPGVLPRLFSLCASAHQIAFLAAVESARERDVGADVKRRRVTALLAEWLSELLRGLFVGRIGLDGVGAVTVRSMMQAAAHLGHGAAESGHQSRREVLSKIRTDLAALGVSNGPAPAPGSALALHLAALDRDAFSPAPVEQSFLSAADDREVVARLAADGSSFADAPDLHGNVPETGTWARCVMREPALPKVAGPAERLRARIAESARLCGRLEAAEAGNEDVLVEDGIIRNYNLGAGQGAAAVECARGRLYHLVQLDDEERIVRFEFLAPTEWNFHARGPLVRALKGSAVAGARQCRHAVRAMVGSFDPCVGFNLSFREAADA